MTAIEAEPRTNVVCGPPIGTPIAKAFDVAVALAKEHAPRRVAVNLGFVAYVVSADRSAAELVAECIRWQLRAMKHGPECHPKIFWKVVKYRPNTCAKCRCR